jgi:coenzyme PQQ synthesis protein D (PqqD)
MIPGKWVHPIDFENHLLLFNQKNKKLVSLNTSAKVLWQGLESNIPVNEIVDILARSSKADMKQVSSDFEKIISQWQELGFFDVDIGNAKGWENDSTGENQFSEKQLTLADIPFSATIFRGQFQLGNIIFKFSTPDKNVLDHIIPYSSHLPVGGPAFRIMDLVAVKIRGQYVLFKDGVQADSCRNMNEIVPMIHAGILLSVYENSEKCVGVHSAFVERNGQSVLIPGKSGSGKSTLTAALIQSGFQFSADDLVFLLPEQGSALPISSPMGLKKGSWKIIARHGYWPENYQTHQRADDQQVKYIFPPERQMSRFDRFKPAHVQCIIYPEFRPGSSFCFDSITPIESVCLLADAGFCLPDTFGKKDVQILMEWITMIPAYQLSYSRLEEAVNAVCHICP